MIPVVATGGAAAGAAVDGSPGGGGASSANAAQSALSSFENAQFGMLMMLVRQKMSDMQEAIES